MIIFADILEILPIDDKNLIPDDLAHLTHWLRAIDLTEDTPETLDTAAPIDIAVTHSLARWVERYTPGRHLLQIAVEAIRLPGGHTLLTSTGDNALWWAAMPRIVLVPEVDLQPRYFRTLTFEVDSAKA